MKEIPLTQGKVALVDDEDYAELVKHKWYARRSGSTRWYAFRNVQMKDRRITVGMHRMILRVQPGQEVDHASGDGLDNRRANLRPCNKRQNQMNGNKRMGCSSQYKGVAAHRDKWRAYINTERGLVFLGSFHLELDAARAYNRAATVLFGNYARLNEID
jgi:hypothetical protein